MYYPKISIQLKKMGEAKASQLRDVLLRLTVAIAWIAFFYLAIQASKIKTPRSVSKNNIQSFKW